MADRDRYEPGTPSWVDLATNDQAGAKAFYGALFGWEYDDVPVGPDAVYSMAKVRGRNAAAIAPQQAEQIAAGVHVPAFDVMDAGRMSVINDPSGAFVMLWTGRANPGAGVVNEPGAFTWSELVAPPNPKIASFYETVTGLKTYEMPMPDGSAYGGFTLDGTPDTMVAGTMAPQMPGIPNHWTVYFGAADVDASAAKVTELGGAVLVEPFDIPVGRMAVCADPQGATFDLFRMSPPA